MPEHPEPDLYVEMPDGRRVGVDDRGDPDGVAVLFFHGTPDTRLARHPDDRIAVERRVRLLAPDRPGIGSSDVDPQASPTSVADDHARILDDLSIGEVAVLAWSAGSIAALAFAGRHAHRVRRITLVAPLVPADAYADPGVLEGADDSRRLFADVLASTSPDEAGRELAMWLVPPEIDEPTATAMLADSIAAISHIDGARDALTSGLLGSVSQGMVGMEREISSQATLLGTTLDGIGGPGSVHVGALDRVTPPAMGRWLGTRLDLPVTVHEDEGHLLAIRRWTVLLDDAAGTTPAVEPARQSRTAGSTGPAASGSIQEMDGTSDQSRSSS